MGIERLVSPLHRLLSKLSPTPSEEDEPIYLEKISPEERLQEDIARVNESLDTDPVEASRYMIWAMEIMNFSGITPEAIGLARRDFDNLKRRVGEKLIGHYINELYGLVEKGDYDKAELFLICIDSACTSFGVTIEQDLSEIKRVVGNYSVQRSLEMAEKAIEKGDFFLAEDCLERVIDNCRYYGLLVPEKYYVLRKRLASKQRRLY